MEATNTDVELYTIAETAQVLACSRWTVNQLIWSGRLVRVHLTSSTRSARITVASVRDYLAHLVEEAA